MGVGPDAVDVGRPARPLEGADLAERRESPRGRGAAVGLLRGIGLAGLLCALIGWEYAPSLRGGFVYEDDRMTDACTAMNPIPTPARVWSSAFWRGRSITRASWCWQLRRGHSAVMFRCVNLALHALVSALVGALLWRLTQAPMLSVAGAAFFAVNAVNVEAVAYLSSRSELIAAIGVLSACLAALAGRWAALVPAALAFGMGGKETALVGLMVVPLVLWWRWRGVWAWLTVASVTFTLSALLSVTAQAWWTVQAWPWFRQVASAMARVMVLSIVPIGQTVDYDYASVPSALAVLAGAWGLAGLVWAWRHRQTYPLAWFGACWLLVTLAPRVLVPTPLSVFPEHQFYLPMFGLSCVLASFVADARRLPVMVRDL